MYDVLIIGGGVSGMQCALVLGSGLKKPYAINKKVGIIMHHPLPKLSGRNLQTFLHLKNIIIILHSRQNEVKRFWRNNKKNTLSFQTQRHLVHNLIWLI